jgi:hypothetical protein
MNEPKPIGVPRKRTAKKDSVAQISFRIPGRMKRRFVSLLDQNGLEIKQVLTEFIETYIEFGGKVGVVKWEPRTRTGRS